MRKLSPRVDLIGLLKYTPIIMNERELDSEQAAAKKTIHLRGGAMVIYRPVLSIGNVDIISLPSKPGHKILFLGKSVPGTEGLSGPIRKLKNRVAGVGKSEND